MRCLNCGQENKDTAKACKKCDRDLTLPPVWFPDWRWHVRTLAAIYAILIVVFFAAKYLLRRLPPPYDIRDIPPEMTPWLQHRRPHQPDLAPQDTPEVSPLPRPAPTAK
jgi:hypothetical protein